MSLSLRNLSVTLDKNPILHDISLEIPRGSFFSLLGPSGSGKSTLLKTIAGLIRQETGHILRDGKVLDALPPEKRGLAMVFQDLRLFPHLTVLDNTAFPLKMAGIKKAERYKTALRMLALVQLDGLESRRPHQLSGGQQQRAVLARALAASPKALLLDEPFSSLDPPLRADMRDLLGALHREMDATIILVTHDQEEALAMSDRMAVMSAGRILQTGAPRDIYLNPNSLAVARHFFRNNYIEGRVSGGSFEGGGLSIALPEPQEAGAVTALLPPESLTLTPTTEASAGASIGVFAVSRVEYAGNHLKATVTNGAINLQGYLSPQDAATPPSQVHLTVNPNRVTIFSHS